MRFTPVSHYNVPSDILVLKRDLGGAIGRLSFGNDKIEAVLKLDENTYVTQSKVNRTWDVIANLDQAVIHQVDKPVDVYDFKERYKEISYGKATPKP